MLIFESSYYAFGFYTALNALILLVLGMLVVRARVRTQTDIGDGGKPDMAGPLRAHGNNAEYTPMALLLMWGLTLPTFGASIYIIHAIGGCLTLGRIIHAIGLSRSVGPSPMRFIGMILTWLAYVIGIVMLLWYVFTTGAPTVS